MSGSDDQPVSTHGGRREGAGRKKSVDAPVRRTVYLGQRHVELITRHQQPGATFSEALRQILKDLEALVERRSSKRE